MLIKVNGRIEFTERVSSVRKVRKGIYEAISNNQTYLIEGGRELGGTSRDWFMSGPGFVKHVNCTSVADAIRVLEGM